MDRILSFLKSNSINELNELASNVATVVFADGSSRGGTRLSFGNGLCVDESSSIEPSSKVVMDNSYKAILKQVDFVTKYEEVRCEVNSWAEKVTNGLIKEILQKGFVDSQTRLILANALYFKGDWTEKFDTSKTKNSKFHLLNGSSVEAPFMTSFRSKYIGVFDSFKVLNLPYKRVQDTERRFSMYVFLPDARDGLPALIERVYSEPLSIDQYIRKIRSVPVGRFLIPKFKMSSDFDAAKVLKTLGLELPNYQILHKAVIIVNEEGTEAAAVTVGLVRARSRPPPPVDFVADHPFLFLIREEVTGTVMFAGQVLNPIDNVEL